MTPRSRIGDWDTSDEAGCEADVKGEIMKLVLFTMREAGDAGLIDDELCKRVNIARGLAGLPEVPISSVAKRRGELCDRGLVHPTPERRESRWHRQQIVWKAT